MAQFPMLAAIEWGQVFGLIILVISILSWFINAIKGNPPKPGGGPVAPQQPRNELEQFLKQVLEANRPKPAPPRPAERPVERPQTNPAAGRSKLKNKPKRPPVKPAAPVFADEDRPSPPGSVARQHLKTSNLSSGVESHLRSHFVEDRREEAAQRQRMSGSEHLGERVRDSVRTDLGGGLAASAPIAPTVVQTHPLMTWLAQPGSIQNAIAVQEILQKPRALRRD
jgi:hypothetical protein